MSGMPMFFIMNSTVKSAHPHYERPVPADYTVTAETTIFETIKRIDRSLWISLALIVDAEGRLINTISDGDIRRGLVRGIEMDSPVASLLPIKETTPHPLPTVAPADTPLPELLRLMREKSLRQVPLVDDAGRVLDVVTLQELLPQAQPLVNAVIMAGGFGTRLHPLTEHMPKPMLEVDGRPIIEHIVDHLKDSGIRDIKVTTHFMPEMIRGHFGDGHAFGVKISYLNEETPLGTAGALGLMPRPAETTMIINGDILTKVDFNSFIAYHYDNHADMTIAVTRYAMMLPYGVVDSDGERIISIREKPKMNFLVNAGIYLMEPIVYDYVPQGTSMQMTDLVVRLIADGKHLVSFPIFEEWIDIGHLADYTRAQDAFTSTHTS